MPLTLRFCLTFLKSSSKWCQMHQSCPNTCIAWSRIQKFPFKLRSPYLWHCIFLTENKSQKLEKKNLKRNSRNSGKPVREMISLRRSCKRFFSKSTKTPFYKRNSVTNSNTCWTIAKTLKRCQKQRFTNTWNVIGNILHQSKSPLRSHQQ